MNFFKLMLSKSASPTLNYKTLFVERAKVHRTRMTKSVPDCADLLRSDFSDELLAQLSSVAQEKMTQTAFDGEEHSIMLGANPISYCIATLPVMSADAAEWYEKRYGGYVKVLEHCWNSEAYLSAGSEVLCHITYGSADRHVWLDISLCPVRSSRFLFQPILAIDLLSASERKNLGVT